MVLKTITIKTLIFGVNKLILGITITEKSSKETELINFLIHALLFIGLTFSLDKNMEEPKQVETRNTNTEGGNYNENFSGNYFRNNATIRNIIQIFIPGTYNIPKAEEERSYRGILLNRVEDFWLRKQQSTIELRLKERLDLTDGYEPTDMSPEFTTIFDIFKAWKEGQNLLILGEPGAGKTTALLQLVKKFVERATKDGLNQQIPVIFDLSSWNDERIDTWLIKELKTKYRVAEWLGKRWIKKENIILFLDGLNEMNTQNQSACVRSLNQFMQEYGRTEIVVCSRTQVYEELSERLTRVQRVVCIQPLTPEQISQYLDRYGEQLKELNSLLQEDNMLSRLATTPLMLNVITQVRESLPKTGSLKECRSSLLKAYIERIFRNNRHRSGRYGQKYTKDQVIDWLTWLAQKMSKEPTNIFLIEQMQPRWLTEEQRKAYQRIVIVYNGILSGVPLGVSYGTIIYFFISHFWEQPESNLGRGVLLGIIAGIVIGPAGTYFEKLHNGDIKVHGKVQISWQEAKNNFLKILFLGIVRGLVVLLFCLIIMPFFFTWHQSLITGLFAAPFIGSVTIISRIASNTLVDAPIETTIKSNQGIFDSLNQAFTIAIISMVILAIIYILIILIIGKMDPIMFILGLYLSAITGIVIAIMHSSGRSCIQHYAMRTVLQKSGCIPKDYASFLDYASELTLLEKIGGSYKFFHEFFLEYFASSSNNNLD